MAPMLRRTNLHLGAPQGRPVSNRAPLVSLAKPCGKLSSEARGIGVVRGRPEGCSVGLQIRHEIPQGAHLALQLLCLLADLDELRPVLIDILLQVV